MKRLFAVTVSLILALSLVFLSFNSSKNISADDPEPPYTEQVKTLLNSYIVDGKYTKLTKVSYDSNSENYHAGANAAQRRTYYDETANALFMGNYDGTVGAINSGYALSGSDMVHYSNNAEVKTTENLFTSRNEDYHLSDTNPIEYFDVLSEIAIKVSGTNPGRWDYEGGVYTYTSDQVATINGNTYTNGLLKMLQYFAAPMLLLNNNIGLMKANFMEKDAYVGDTLSKVLYIELLDNNDNEVSHAIIVKGLTMEKVVIVDSGLLYLNANIWNTNDARFAAYFFIKNGETTVSDEWVSMDVVGDGVYVVEVPATYRVDTANVIFARMKGNEPTNNWDNRWNQTYDLSLKDQFGKTYMIDKWHPDDNESGNSTGHWY